jgi:hypothetical protein
MDGKPGLKAPLTARLMQVLWSVQDGASPALHLTMPDFRQLQVFESREGRWM